MAGKLGALEQLLQYVQRARATGEDKAAQAAVQHLAKGLYADVPALDVYHGSPHVWDEPAFTDNLLRGEGALAFGPGGYTTGHRPLAAEYARNLSGEGGRSATLRKPGPTQTAAWVDLARATDPTDFAVANVMMQRGLHRYTDLYDNTTDVAAQLRGEASPALRKLALKPITKNIVPQVLDLAQPTDAQLRTIRDAAPVLDKVARANPGRTPEGWSDNRGRSINLRNSANAAKYLADPTTARSLTMGQSARDILGAVNPATVNGGNFPVLMGPVTPSGVRIGETRPNIYELSLQASPADLLPYDAPAATASPRVLGALELLHRAAGMTLDPDQPGRALLQRLGLHQSDNPQMAAQVLREAGLPGLYYPRAGQRSNWGSAPETFNPDDYNFVTFDDSVLKLKSRANKAHGGSV